MKNEEIQKARKEYARRQKEKNELIMLKEELSLLKEDPRVKRYLEILYVDGRNIPNENEIIRYSFTGLEKNSDDFNVYFYMGAYRNSYSYDEADNQVFDRSKADYLLYLNIEDEFDFIQIKPNMQEQFEKDNIVLKTERILNAQSKYYELQRVYYEYLLKEDLRCSKNKILEKIKEHL